MSEVSHLSQFLIITVEQAVKRQVYQRGPKAELGRFNRTFHDRDSTDGVVKQLRYVLGPVRLDSNGIQFGELGASNRASGMVAAFDFSFRSIALNTVRISEIVGDSSPS